MIKDGELIAADGTPIGGIEGEDDGMPFEIGKGDELVGGGFERERGCFCSGLEGLRFCFASCYDLFSFGLFFSRRRGSLLQGVLKGSDKRAIGE